VNTIVGCSKFGSATGLHLRSEVWEMRVDFSIRGGIGLNLLSCKSSWDTLGNGNEQCH
jgi:hypothetical protein